MVTASSADAVFSTLGSPVCSVFQLCRLNAVGSTFISQFGLLSAYPYKVEWAAKLQNLRTWLDCKRLEEKENKEKMLQVKIRDFNVYCGHGILEQIDMTLIWTLNDVCFRSVKKFPTELAHHWKTPLHIWTLQP